MHARMVNGIGWEIGLDQGETLGFAPDHDSRLSQHSRSVSPIFETEREAEAFRLGVEVGRGCGDEEGYQRACADLGEPPTT